MNTIIIANNKIDELSIIDALVVINAVLLANSNHVGNLPIYNKKDDKIFAVRCNCGHFHPIFGNNVLCELEYSKETIKSLRERSFVSIYKGIDGC